MLFFGGIVGGLVGIAGLGLSEPPHYNLVALFVTLAVFFVIGFVYLDRGADFVAMCASSFLIVLSLGTETALYSPERKDFSPRWCLFILIAWLATMTYILLNF